MLTRWDAVRGTASHFAGAPHCAVVGRFALTGILDRPTPPPLRSHPGSLLPAQHQPVSTGGSSKSRRWVSATAYRDNSSSPINLYSSSHFSAPLAPFILGKPTENRLASFLLCRRRVRGHGRPALSPDTGACGSLSLLCRYCWGVLVDVVVHLSIRHSANGSETTTSTTLASAPRQGPALAVSYLNAPV